MIRKLLLLFLTQLVCLSGVLATHIVGGELTYQCLGGDMYQIRLSVYRDCYNGVPQFDDPASVGIFDANNNLLSELMLPFSSMDDTLTLYLNNPCLTAPPDVCVHRTTYMTTVSLPFLTGGYQIVYQRCCRNKLIQNIPLPEDVGITIIAEIKETALQQCNQGATYKNWPPLAICVNEPIDFDHGAVDSDGDSLVYRLCTPLNGATPDTPQPSPPYSGPYQEIIWNDPPYNLNNLLGGDPLKINPQTGFITGVPNTIGNFVVGVCVDEYRNGEIISTLRRDFQYNVADCGVPVAAFFSPDAQCEDLQVSFTNSSVINPDATNTIYQWYFDWYGNRDLKSNDFSPVYNFPDTGTFTVALVLNPGYSCCDTFLKTITLSKRTVSASVGFSYSNCDDTGVTVLLSDNSTDPFNPITNRTWNVFGPNGNLIMSSILPNPQFIATNPGVYTAYLVVTSDNGCTAETALNFTVPLPPILTFQDKLTICKGDSIGLFPDANDDFLYQWAPDTELSSVTAPNPLASPSVNTTYTVTITDAAGLCTRIRTVEVSVVQTPVVIATADPELIVKGQSSQLNAIFPGALGFEWSPAGSLSDPTIANPVATPDDTTWYQVVVKTSSGCSPSALVRVAVILPQCDLPYVFFPKAFSPNGDSENDILKLESSVATEVYWVIYDRWGEKIFEATSLEEAWDGTYKGQSMPAETYGYYLRVRCLNNEVLERSGNVTLLR